MGWQKAYVAMSTLIDGSPDHGLLSLSENDRATVASVASALTHEDRSARAKALANELAMVARALEATDLGVA
jgi:hypothetical protein